MWVNFNLLVAFILLMWHTCAVQDWGAWNYENTQHSWIKLIQWHWVLKIKLENNIEFSKFISTQNSPKNYTSQFTITNSNQHPSIPQKTTQTVIHKTFRLHQHVVHFMSLNKFNNRMTFLHKYLIFIENCKWKDVNKWLRQSIIYNEMKFN